VRKRRILSPLQMGERLQKSLMCCESRWIPAQVFSEGGPWLRVYGSFSATELERLTHEETPWKEARAGLPPDAPSRKPIDIQSMKEFYSSLVV
jgi:hypothetical protein